MLDGGLLQDLLGRARAGEVDARNRVLTELYPVVRKHVCIILNFDPISEDAAQEAMLEICRALPSFRFNRSLRAWALTIACRKARRFRRGQQRHRAALTTDGQLQVLARDAGIELQPDLRALFLALDRLPEKKREAYILMEVFEMSAREAAGVLGTFANTAASRCRHAKAELMAALADGERRREATS